MTESLRALLAGAIDYAGMFPPASLSFEQAFAQYRAHRAAPEAWMLGRFVCPAGQLRVITAVLCPRHDGGVSVIVPGADTSGAFSMSLDDALSVIRDSPAAKDVDTIESSWPAHLLDFPDPRVFGIIVRMAGGKISATNAVHLTVFFEIPALDGHFSDSTWLRLVRALADFNQNAGSGYCTVGFKLRCGGAGAGAIPSSAAIAAVITACRDHGVFWKATAGLHHPFRHVDPQLGVPVQGFLNLLTAAVMADVHRLDTERVQAILEDDDPWHFRFTNEALTWHEFSATVPQIVAARKRSLRSFGSCSIDEPWHDLRVLGLV